MRASPELRDRVRIEPPLPRDELPALLAGADALLSATQPRGSETLDKVVYEAAACEVPVVASNAALKEFLDGLPLRALASRRATPRRSPIGSSRSRRPSRPCVRKQARSFAAASSPTTPSTPGRTP